MSFQLKHPRHADLNRDVQMIADSWQKARRILDRAKGLCSCGTRWSHLMDGMNVILSDSLEVIARCWDDDRLLINPRKFSQEPDGAETLVHEFGHRVWFQCLDRKQQDTWHQSWMQNKSGTGASCRGLVSSYACTDELEDFAEVFTALVYGRATPTHWKRWQAVCGCGKTECKPTPPPALARAGDRRHADRRRPSRAEAYLTAYLGRAR